MSFDTDDRIVNSQMWKKLAYVLYRCTWKILSLSGVLNTVIANDNTDYNCIVPVVIVVIISTVKVKRIKWRERIADLIVCSRRPRF